MLRPHGAVGLDALFCCALPDRGGHFGSMIPSNLCAWFADGLS